MVERTKDMYFPSSFWRFCCLSRRFKYRSSSVSRCCARSACEDSGFGAEVDLILLGEAGGVGRASLIVLAADYPVMAERNVRGCFR